MPGVPQPIKASKQKEMAEMVLVRRRKKSLSEEEERQSISGIVSRFEGARLQPRRKNQGAPNGSAEAEPLQDKDLVG
jgi:hypothetical protein